MIHERFLIRGSVGAAAFPPWILRYAGKFGVSARIEAADAVQIALEIRGAPDLVDAVELGCSLGPIEVWVDEITRESIAP